PHMPRQQSAVEVVSASDAVADDQGDAFTFVEFLDPARASRLAHKDSEQRGSECPMRRILFPARPMHRSSFRGAAATRCGAMIARGVTGKRLTCANRPLSP